MTLFSKTAAPIMHIKDRLINFIKNSQAVAAVEFALIAPILLLLFVGTVEISLLVSVDRKISRTSSAVADLIAQGDNYTTADGIANLRSIFGVTERIMYPYSDRIPCVVISIVEAQAESDTNGDGSIDGDDDVVARVRLSFDNKTASADYTSPPSGQCDRNSASLTDDENARQVRVIDSVFPLPDAINTHGSVLVIGEVEYDHKPIIGFVSTKGGGNVEFDKASITLGDRIYLRPRKTITLP